jgi:hypothetical protein
MSGVRAAPSLCQASAIKCSSVATSRGVGQARSIASYFTQRAPEHSLRGQYEFDLQRVDRGVEAARSGPDGERP